MILIWVFLVLLEVVVRFVRGGGGMFEGGYTSIEGRRYRQDMLLGGHHGEHRECRRGVVERLALVGSPLGSTLPSRYGYERLGDVEARGRTSDAKITECTCERDCKHAELPRRRSVE